MGRLDVAHLDNFLSSLWGKKLFSHKRPQREQRKEGLVCATGGARPCPAFLATSRDTVCPDYFNSQQLHLTARPESLRSDLYSLSRRMKHLESRIEAQEQRSRGLLSHIEKRHLAVSCKRLREEHTALKAQKQLETKKTRVYNHWYPKERTSPKPLSNTYRDSLFRKYCDTDIEKASPQPRKKLLSTHRAYNIISGLVHNS